MLSFTEFFKKKDPIVDIIEVDAKETKIADYLIKNYKKHIGFKDLEIDVTSWVLTLSNYNLKVKNGDLIVIYRKSPYWEVVEKTDTSYQSLQSYKGKFKYW
jgi:hypothetical protein